MIQIAPHADVLRGSSRVTSKNVCVGRYDPKEFLAAYAARDGFAAKSHSTTTQYRQLSRLFYRVVRSFWRVFVFCDNLHESGEK